MKTERRYSLRFTYEVGGKPMIQTMICETEEEASLRWKENMVGQTRIFDTGMTTGILSKRQMRVVEA